jgi:hypothetical protein
MHNKFFCLVPYFYSPPPAYSMTHPACMVTVINCTVNILYKYKTYFYLPDLKCALQTPFVNQL